MAFSFILSTNVILLCAQLNAIDSTTNDMHDSNRKQKNIDHPELENACTLSVTRKKTQSFYAPFFPTYVYEKTHAKHLESQTHRYFDTQYVCIPHRTVYTTHRARAVLYFIIFERIPVGFHVAKRGACRRNGAKGKRA